MLNRPRSTAKLTGSVSTGPWMTPSTTRCTLPVLFSVTSRSSGPRNATPVGSVSPLTTVLSARCGSSSDGVEAGGTTVVTAVAVLFVGSGSASLARTVAVLLSSPGLCGVTAMTTAAPPPSVRFPMLQVIVVVPVHGMDTPPRRLTVAETKVRPAGRVSVTVTPVATIAGPLLKMFML
jgi:hypothetical protein